LNFQDSSYEKRTEMNFGKFYNQSYLKTGSQKYVHRGRTLSEPKGKNNVNQFIRPGGMQTLAQGKTVTKTRRSSSPGPQGTPPPGTKTGIRQNLEAVRMSTFPGGKPPPPREIAKIERDDWPAPPSPAAILPEILRQRRKSRGEEDEEEEEGVFEDPKIKREIEELKKFKDESGIGKVIYNELEVAKSLPSKPLDPWKSSRVPNAKYEPKYQTRYQSPMFASPSRFIDRSRRSWDDIDIRGYRTISVVGNFPAPKPGYGLDPRAATLPVSGIYGGPLDLDFVTSTIFDQPGVSLMTFQKSSWHTDTKPPEYQYERLKISNFDLPRDVDRNMLEIHLPDGEFSDIFGMEREEFRHLPEWKRNDMKRKKDLY
ncbi:ABLM1-like protein, partial [Mya arenaria]